MDTNIMPETASGTARTAADDGRTHYDGVAMSLHWLTVVLVLMQFGLAQLWDFAPRPGKHLMIVAHMSFGILLAAVIILRLFWRLVPAHRVRPVVSGWAEAASRAVHWLLYGLLAAEAVLGYLLRWSGNEAMSFFGLLMPPPFVPFSKAAHGLVGDLHNWAGWAIIILAAGHAAAALFHHFVLRDGVLRQMLPERRGGVRVG